MVLFIFAFSLVQAFWQFHWDDASPHWCVLSGLCSYLFPRLRPPLCFYWRGKIVWWSGWRCSTPPPLCRSNFFSCISLETCGVELSSLCLYSWFILPFIGQFLASFFALFKLGQCFVLLWCTSWSFFPSPLLIYEIVFFNIIGVCYMNFTCDFDGFSDYLGTRIKQEIHLFFLSQRDSS